MNSTLKPQQIIECRIYGGYYHLPVKSWNANEGEVTVEGAHADGHEWTRTLKIAPKSSRVDTCALVDPEADEFAEVAMFRDGQGNRYCMNELRSCQRIDHGKYVEYVTSSSRVYVAVPR